MRIISYNILDGAEGRADPVAEVIEAQQADVVVLIEADDPVVLQRIARRMKMDCVAGGRGRKAAAILSRFTITESINHAALDKSDHPIRSFLQATVRDPAGVDWPIFALHLHPRATLADEQVRLRQLYEVLRKTQSLRQSNSPHILAGDFNANSPIAQIDPQKLKPKSRAEWQSNGQTIPRDAIQKVLSAGYVDTLAHADPQAAPSQATFTTHHPGQRVDYIFTRGIDPHRIKSAWIERDRLAEFASDHFPVGVEIR